MRRTRRALAGAVLAAGLGLTGCTQDEDFADVQDDTVPTEEAGEPGDADRVDGGDEDPDSVDPGTGGIYDDDDTSTDEDTDQNDQ